MQAFFENVCSAAASAPSPPPPLLGHAHSLCTLLPAIWLMFALGIALQTLALGAHANMAATLAASLKVPEKVCYSFVCALPRGEACLICVLPSLTLSFGHVILKSISNRVAPPLLSPPSSPLIFLHENHELVVKNGGSRGSYYLVGIKWRQWLL